MLSSTIEPRTAAGAAAGEGKAAFRPDIEGLRAIAVLLVVAYHAGVPLFRGGFVGVDVFFVLSGYLITGLLLNELVKTSRISFVRFYARRVRRLLPASALTVLVTIAAAHFLLSPLEQVKLVRSAFSTVAYVSNFYFAQSTRDYFAADTASNPMLHTWSLAVEEQFYCFWPMLLFLAYRCRRSRRDVGSFMAALSVISLGYCIWYTHTNPSAAFFLSPVRAWQFGVGGLFSMISAKRLQGLKRQTIISGYLGLVGIFLAAVVYSSQTHFPGAAAILPTVATGLALLAGVGAPGAGIGRLLHHPILQRFGELSYSIYLWHWPVLVLTAAYVEHFTAGIRAACVLAAFVIAALTHYLIENPIRFNRHLMPHPRLSVALAGLVTVLSLGGVACWRHMIRSSPQYALYAGAANDEPRLYAMGCSTSFTEEKPQECHFGPGGAATTVVLFGDSHAAQWFPALEDIAREHSWQIVTFIRNACPAADVPAFDSRFGAYEQQCSHWRSQVLDRILALHPSLVIMGSRARYWKSVDGGLQPLSYGDWRDGTAHTFERLRSEGVPVLLLGDTPRPGFDVPNCLARVAWKGSGHCDPFLRSKSLNDSVFLAEQEAARQFSGVTVLDLAGQICHGAYCDIIRNGMILYRDNDHLTGTFARSLTPVLAAGIQTAYSETLAGSH
jgi:peptidoglycan/LPS O-acetylase OafA/YrhL